MRTLSLALLSIVTLGAGSSVVAQELPKPEVLPPQVLAPEILSSELGPEIACESCSINPVTGPAQNVYQPGWVVQVNGQYSSLGTGMDGETTLANRQQQHLNSTIAQISAAYNFSEEFGLQLNVPYIHRSFRRVAGSNIESGVLSGLGDITINGRYTPIARSSEDGNFFWNLQLGLKLPTGSSSALQDEASHLHGGGHGEHDHSGHDHGDHDHDHDHDHGDHDHGDHDHDIPSYLFIPPSLDESLIGGHDLALGSGSFDAVVGTSLFWQQKSLYVNAGAQYMLRSRGSYDYQYGNTLLWNLSPGIMLRRDEEQMWGLQMNVSGEFKDQDNVSGVRIDHTGSTSVFAGPQVFGSSKDLNFLAGLDFPLYQRTDAATIVPDYRLRFQLNWKL